jgi:hypothetical protein
MLKSFEVLYRFQLPLGDPLRLPYVPLGTFCPYEMVERLEVCARVLRYNRGQLLQPPALRTACFDRLLIEEGGVVSPRDFHIGLKRSGFPFQSYNVALSAKQLLLGYLDAFIDDGKTKSSLGQGDEGQLNPFNRCDNCNFMTSLTQQFSIDDLFREPFCSISNLDDLD